MLDSRAGGITCQTNKSLLKEGMYVRFHLLQLGRRHTISEGILASDKLRMFRSLNCIDPVCQ